MSKQIGVFLDVGNLYYFIGQKYNGKLDYEKYLNFIKSKFGTVYRALAYGAQNEKEAKGFITSLKLLGYDTRYKSPRQNGPGYVDWNVGMAVDIVRHVNAKHCNLIVIGSSNHNLVPVVEWVKEQGIRAVITACYISKELKEAADQYIEIKDDLLEIKEPVPSDNSIDNS